MSGMHESADDFVTRARRHGRAYVDGVKLLDVQTLGQRLGFGFVMHRSQELWRASLVESGAPPGGELIVGPCATFTVPCGCKRPHTCAWCCGSGWLTKRCKDAKEAARE